MEVKDYNELLALNKLLGRIKFQSDIDFNTFDEFAASPFIANIFNRVQEELREEAIKRGHVETGQKPAFEFDSPSGKTICKRIDGLTEEECETLRNSNNTAIDHYLRILISPLEPTEKEFDRLRQYAYMKTGLSL